MPSVELVDGKWVKVDGVRAEDLDGVTAKKPAPAPAPAPTPAVAPKPVKAKAVAPAGLTAKQQKEITTPKTNG